MDLNRLREDFEGLSPEAQMEFMTSVGPAFCRGVLADPARRRALLAHCVREAACPLCRVVGPVAAVGIRAAAFAAGVRAALTHLARGGPRHEETS
jgi:hypothetical protein